MNFSGKVALVTGGASGIGLACVREFADRGAAVAVVDRDAQAGQHVAVDVCRKGGRAGFF